MKYWPSEWVRTVLRNGTATTASRLSSAISRRYQTVPAAATGRIRASGERRGASGTDGGCLLVEDTGSIPNDQVGARIRTWWRVIHRGSHGNRCA
ncbi:hypothetical protein GCM10009738_47380 [Kitasatospora viridis]